MWHEKRVLHHQIAGVLNIKGKCKCFICFYSARDISLRFREAQDQNNTDNSFFIAFVYNLNYFFDILYTFFKASQYQLIFKVRNSSDLGAFQVISWIKLKDQLEITVDQYMKESIHNLQWNFYIY